MNGVTLWNIINYSIPTCNLILFLVYILINKKFSLRGVENSCVLFIIEIITFLLGLKVDMGHGGAIVPIFASLLTGFLVMLMLIIVNIKCIVRSKKSML